MQGISGHNKGELLDKESTKEFLERIGFLSNKDNLEAFNDNDILVFTEEYATEMSVILQVSTHETIFYDRRA